MTHLLPTRAPRARNFACTTALALSFAACAMPAFAEDGETRITLDDQTAIAVTIYNDNLALMRDARKIRLAAGLNKLAFVDVSAKMRPETAILTGARGVDLSLVEQNFDFDLLTPQKLLEKSVGQTITIVKTHPQTGEETTLKALVLSTAGGVVLKIGDRIETGIPGRIVFDSVPPNLRARPTLVTQVETKTANQAAPVELNYLTGGLSWRADYVAELSDKEDRMAINGWITLVNTSGTSYKNATMQLVAGDLNRVLDNSRVRGQVDRLEAAKPATTVAQQAVFDYHVYTLNRPTTIAENQQKQVALLSAPTIATQKEYIVSSSNYGYYRRAAETYRVKADVFLNFINDAKSGLGLPMPKGVVRVYKRDSAGKAIFVGEDAIDHTAKNEDVKLKMGRAFDVSAEFVQTDYTLIDRDGRIHEAAFKVVLKNAKAEPVVVNVKETLGGEWRILNESHPHEKISSARAQWRIQVPADGSTTLTYRVRIKY